jgi:hypothetical protein
VADKGKHKIVRNKRNTMYIFMHDNPFLINITVPESRDLTKLYVKEHLFTTVTTSNK